MGHPLGLAGEFEHVCAGQRVDDAVGEIGGAHVGRRRRIDRVARRPAEQGDALSARALGDPGRADGDGRSSGGGCGRLRPASCSPGSDAAFSGSDDLRADRGRANRGRPFDLEAPGRAAPDRQTGAVPRRGGSRLQRRPSPQHWADLAIILAMLFINAGVGSIRQGIGPP